MNFLAGQMNIYKGAGCRQGMRRGVIGVLIVLVVFIGIFLVWRSPSAGYAVEGPAPAKSILERVGLAPGKPVPAQPAGPPKLVLVIQGDKGAAVDANVRIYNISEDFDRWNLEDDPPLLSFGTKGRKLFVLNSLMADSKKESQDFFILISSSDYWQESERITLSPGQEKIITFHLRPQSKDRERFPCADSDGGIASLVSGTTTLTPVPKLGAQETRHDRCEGTTLIEYACEEVWDSELGERTAVIVEKKLTCPQGCQQGACIAPLFCRNEVCIAAENVTCQSDRRQGINLFLRNSIRIGSRWEYPEAPARVIPGKIAGNVIYGEARAVPAIPVAPVPVDAGLGGGGGGGEGKPLEPEEGIPPRDIFDERPSLPSFELESSCIDERTIIQYVCSSYAVLQGVPAADSRDSWRGWGREEDESYYPQEVREKCPEGYSCMRGKCVQQFAVPPATYGDVNGDGTVTPGDIAHLQALLARPEIPYEPAADIDGDRYVDSYDLYRLQRFVQGAETPDMRLPVRTFNLSTSRLYIQGLYTPSTLDEFRQGRVKRFVTEHQQKGNSRGSCRPPVLNIKFKKKDLFYGWTTFPGFSVLGYQKVKFIPDCDILSQHEVDNQLREYIIYSAFREFGVPTIDVAGFARLWLNAPDHGSLELNQYMLLQRDDEKDDQIPFMRQFELHEVIQASDKGITYSVAYDRDDAYNRFTHVIVERREEGKEPVSRQLALDPDVSIRYTILEDFFELGDRMVLHNEHYGLDAATGLWKPIPFDMDSSFRCYSGERLPGNIAGRIANVPFAQRKMYAQKTLNITREIFDNVTTLHYLLSLVDRYPFEENKDKMKNMLRLRFYQHALYYGSQEFAAELHEPHVPFVNQEAYLKEARRILAEKNYATMCSNDEEEFQEGLRRVLALYGVSPPSRSADGNAPIPVGPLPGFGPLP